MINLLPTQALGEIRRDYYQRLVVVGSLAIVGIASMTLIIFIGLWGVLMFKERGVQAIHQASLQSANSQKFDQLTAVVADVNAKTALVASLSTKSSAYDTMTVVLNNKTTSITFTKISFKQDASGVGALTVQGIYSTRQDFVAFTESLQKNPHIAEVSSPVSNLIKERAGEFTIDIHFKKMMAVQP